MKKLKLMTVFFAGIIGFFILTLTIHAKTELFVEINPEKNRIVFKNQDVDFSKESMKVYELITEEEEVLSHHILSFNEVYGIILYKTYIGEKYTLEGYVVLEEGLKTCLQKISKEEYEYLINGAQSVLDTSELGMKLKKNQGRFEAYHTYVLDNPITNDGIEGYALERHNRSIQTMTNTDEYIKGYYPNYESSSPYIRTYTDNIINIIPENWFFKEGNYAYVGKEYAVAVSTKPAKSHSYDNDCMLANVGVFDIDVALPYLHKSEDSSAVSGYIYMSDQIIISIKPIINLSYYAYEKKNFSNDYWNRKFDITEERTVVARKESSNTIYIEPKSMGYLIDDRDSIDPNHLCLFRFSYELLTTTQLSQFMENIKMQSMRIDTFLNLSAILLGEGLSAVAPEFSVPIKMLEKVISHFSSIVGKEYVGMKTEMLEKDWDEYNNIINNQKFVSNFSTSAGDRPITFATTHPSFEEVFKSSLLNTYTHQYRIQLFPKGDWFPLKDYFYDLHLSSIFNFYDNYTFKITEIASNQSYENLNLYIDSTYILGQAKCIEVNKGTQLTTSLSNTKLTSTMVILAQYTGLTELKLTSSTSVIADVYNEIGNLIQSNISSYSYNDSLLLRLEEGKKYFIFLRFSYETSGTIYLKFNQLNEFYNNVTGLSQYDTYGVNNTNSQYVFLNLTTGGLYSIYTNLEYDDTTIRIYDENLRLLGESYDPDADWNEDEPDLNAHCYLSSTGPNRKVIVQLFRSNPQKYKLYVNYFSLITN